ncbi:MAG: MlrC C-terminal domain-containing protein [Rhizomicrobium sp.]
MKSTQHFRSHFASLADEIILVATPGTLQMDFAMLPYRKKRSLEYFPRTSDPLGYSTVAPKTGEGS